MTDLILHLKLFRDVTPCKLIYFRDISDTRSASIFSRLLQLWRQRQHVFFSETSIRLHDLTYQKTVIFTVTDGAAATVTNILLHQFCSWCVTILKILTTLRTIGPARLYLIFHSSDAWIRKQSPKLYSNACAETLNVPNLNIFSVPQNWQRRLEWSRARTSVSQNRCRV